jgi:hypothetical protein
LGGIKEGEGGLQNLLLFPPPLFKTGEGIGGGRTGRRRRLPALSGTTRVGEWGGMGRRLRRFDSHPHIGLRRREEAAPRAAADCRRCWLGVAAFEGSGSGWGGAGCDKERHRLFIGRARRWSGRDRARGARAADRNGGPAGGGVNGAGGRKWQQRCG